MYKALRLSDYTVCVSVLDPAIDITATGDEEFTKYQTERLKNPACFRDILKAKTGEVLSVFEIGVIPPDEMTRISDECKPGKADAKNEEMFWRSFVCGLRGIDHWPSAIDKHKVQGVEYVKPEWIRKTFIRGLRQVAIDIGAQILFWNNLTETEIKNS